METLSVLSSQFFCKFKTYLKNEICFTNVPTLCHWETSVHGGECIDSGARLLGFRSQTLPLTVVGSLQDGLQGPCPPDSHVLCRPCPCPHWIVLAHGTIECCGNERHCGFLLAFSLWLLTLGKASCHTIRTLQERCGEVHMAGNWILH